MNGIEERLDETGAEYRRAAESLPIRRRGDATVEHRAGPPRFVLATAAVVVALVGAVAVIEFAFDQEAPDRVEAIDEEPTPVDPVGAGPELLAAFRRPANPTDALPASVAADLADHDQPELDLSASRAGPSLDGYTAYAVPSLDGLWICTYLVETTGSDRSWGGSCGSLAAVVTSPSPIWSSGSGGTHGIVPDGVIGVEVNGEPALLSDGMFLVAGSSSDPDIELIWEPERATLVEACEALAPLVRLEQRVVPIDASAAVALVAASRATAEPSFVDLADLLAEPGQDGLDLDEIETTEGRLAEVANEAVLTCEQAEVPGWAVVYQPPAGPPGSPTPTVDLSAYGQRQDLAPTDATSELIHGPGLGPVTRAAVGDTGVTAFTWERLNPNLQACVLVLLDGGSTQTCPDRDLSGAFLSMELPAEADLQVQARSNERRAAFATAEVNGETWVQEARGLYFVFVLPAGSATVTFHGPDGTILEPATPVPGDDSADAEATTSSIPEVSKSAYDAAWAEFTSCVSDRGATLTGISENQTFGTYNYSYTADDETVVLSCYNTFFRDAQIGYESHNEAFLRADAEQNVVDWEDEILPCLDASGYDVPAEFDIAIGILGTDRLAELAEIYYRDLLPTGECDTSN